jgi:hypothetical protein
MLGHPRFLFWATEGYQHDLRPRITNILDIRIVAFGRPLAERRRKSAGYFQIWVFPSNSLRNHTQGSRSGAEQVQFHVCFGRGGNHAGHKVYASNAFLPDADSHPNARATDMPSASTWWAALTYCAKTGLWWA